MVLFQCGHIELEESTWKNNRYMCPRCCEESCHGFFLEESQEDQTWIIEAIRFFTSLAFNKRKEIHKSKVSKKKKQYQLDEIDQWWWTSARFFFGLSLIIQKEPTQNV